MDPANSPPEPAGNIEQVLQHQDARFTGLQDQVRQALANQNHALAALTAQLGNLTAALTQAVPLAPSPAMTPPAPASPPPMHL
ncbi:unnamed protein product [Merluccius merluccius]